MMAGSTGQLPYRERSLVRWGLGCCALLLVLLLGQSPALAQVGAGGAPSDADVGSTAAPDDTPVVPPAVGATPDDASPNASAPPPSPVVIPPRALETSAAYPSGAAGEAVVVLALVVDRDGAVSSVAEAGVLDPVGPVH